MKRWLSLARNERGNVLAIVIAMLTVLFLISGVAMDLGHAISVKADLQRAFDAGALAGAARLALDPTDLSAVRTAAQSWAAQNPYSGGALGGGTGLTTPVDNSGNVKTGLWSGGAWTPAITPPAGVNLNAVRCQWTTTVQTSFLGLLGIPLSVSGLSTAAVGPPARPCPTCAVLPLGLPQCGFTSGGSEGCGTLVWSDKVNGSVVWANLNPANSANNSDISSEMVTASAGQPPDSSWNLRAGLDINVTNGDVGYGGTYNALGRFGGPCGANQSCGQFVTKYNASSPIQIKTTGGAEIYNGQGWEMVVPILDMSATGCNQSGSGTLKILTWTYFVMVQFINGGDCTVNNNGYNGYAPWRERCNNAAMGGTASGAPNVNVVYGYYNCKHMDSPPTLEPGPVAATSTQPRLVQ
jgi:Flp pilus assembly protein TadG